MEFLALARDVAFEFDLRHILAEVSQFCLEDQRVSPRFCLNALLDIIRNAGRFRQDDLRSQAFFISAGVIGRRKVGRQRPLDPRVVVEDLERIIMPELQPELEGFRCIFTFWVTDGAIHQSPRTRTISTRILDALAAPTYQDFMSLVGSGACGNWGTSLKSLIEELPEFVRDFRGKLPSLRAAGSRDLLVDEVQNVPGLTFGPEVALDMGRSAMRKGDLDRALCYLQLVISGVCRKATSFFFWRGFEALVGPAMSNMARIWLDRGVPMEARIAISFALVCDPEKESLLALAKQTLAGILSGRRSVAAACSKAIDRGGTASERSRIALRLLSGRAIVLLYGGSSFTEALAATEGDRPLPPGYAQVPVGNYDLIPL